MFKIYRKVNSPKLHNYLIRYKEDFWQNLTSLHNKSPREIRNTRDMPQSIEGNLQYSKANINLNREKLLAFPFKSGTK